MMIGWGDGGDWQAPRTGRMFGWEKILWRQRKNSQNMCESPHWQMRVGVLQHFTEFPLRCLWAAFPAKKRTQTWCLVFSEHRRSLSASLKLCTSSGMCLDTTFVRHTWVLDAPRWSPCSSELSSLSPAAPSLWSHLLATDPATTARRSHAHTHTHAELQIQRDPNDLAAADSHWPLLTGSHWSWPVGKAVYNRYQPAYWGFRFLKKS